MSGALVSSVIANANRAKGAKAYEITDFMVVRNMLKRARDEKESLDREEVHMKLFIASMGGKVH
jgi:hypothetical protein